MGSDSVSQGEDFTSTCEVNMALKPNLVDLDPETIKESDSQEEVVI